MANEEIEDDNNLEPEEELTPGEETPICEEFLLRFASDRTVLRIYSTKFPYEMFKMDRVKILHLRL